jgi:hypothetical protein
VIDRLTARDKELAQELPALQQATVWQPSRFFLAVLTATVTAFAFLWINGLLLQLATLGLDLTLCARRYFAGAPPPPPVSAPRDAYRSKIPPVPSVPPGAK